MPHPLVLPMAAHVALAALLYVLLTIARAPAIWGIGRRADGSNPFAAYEPRISANLSNQFEWPLLFYVACLLLMQGPLDLFALALAWLFVAGRVLHSAVQILTRNVRLRGIVFMLNFVAVLGLWVFAVLPTVWEPQRQRMLEQLEQAEKEDLARAEPQHRLDAFGGTIYGKDLGEWGGEVGFRDPQRGERQLIDDNSQGLFQMPFGVVALTGLAHFSNRGSVYIISSGPGGVVEANKTLTLPGWPCHAEATDTQITMRVFMGHEFISSSTSAPQYNCYSLRSAKDLEPVACPAAIPDGCYQ